MYYKQQKHTRLLQAAVPRGSCKQSELLLYLLEGWIPRQNYNLLSKAEDA